MCKGHPQECVSFLLLFLLLWCLCRPACEWGCWCGLKSDTARLEIPEVELKLLEGTLGGVCVISASSVTPYCAVHTPPFCLHVMELMASCSWLLDRHVHQR